MSLTDLLQHKRTEGELRRSREHLEERVAQRTSELSNANALLKEEIAERRQVEEKLTLESSLMQALLTYLPDGIYFKDTASRFVRTGKYNHLIGIDSPEEAVGKTDFDFFPEEFARAAYEDEQRIMQTGQPIINRLDKEVFQDGSECWVSTTKVPIFDSEGKVSGIVGMNRDVTELKKAEEDIQDSRDYLYRIINAVADPIFVKDRQHRWVLMNDAMCRMMGGEREELLNKSDYDFFPAAEADAFWQKDEYVFTTGEETVNEETLTDASGNTRIIHTRKKLHIDTKGEQFIVGVIRDMTERKSAEEEALFNEYRYRLLVEATTAIVWNTPASGEFQTEQPGWTAFTGQSFEELRGWGWLDAVHPDDRAETARVWSAAVASRSIYEVEHRLRRHDGTYQHMLVRATPILDKDKTIREWIGVHTDIAQRKQFESELAKARDAALESTRLKSEFLANMSHEIRTPMNGVLGMIGLLLETDLTETQRDYTETVQSSADALLKIIDDILDFSKIEAGQMRFEKIDFDLREAIEAAIELLAERAAAKQLQLSSLVYNDVPTHLRGDPGRLRQVLINLIGNAIKFTEHGEIVVSVSRESETDQYAALRFEIRDTGIGIAEEAQRRLFHAFTQADGSTTRKYGGTGLGLAISKQLVELMNGEIGVESAPGAGSTFWFTARFEKQPETAVAAKHSIHDVNLEGVRVLIVDDNATNRRVLMHQIASWGMIAVEAETGAEAIGLLRRAAERGEPFDIAILDMTMTDMNGFQLAQIIKSDKATASVRLVLLPSFGKRGDGETARHAGISAYLQKPVRQSQLYNCLTAVMRQSIDVDTGGAARLVTRHSLRETEAVQNVSAAFAGIRILVAEDNPVNQRVALRQLQHLGYNADAVSNGREALEAVEKIHYDVIFMDCQMPVMDGFEATAEIRQKQSGGETRTTIIAMTANAIEGDREKCLDAGMDDYLSKPVKAESLREMLERWIVSRDEKRSENLEPCAEQNSTEQPFLPVDFSVLESFGEMQKPGTPDLITELIDLFLSDTQLQLTALREAFAQKDVVLLERVSHRLKGGSASVGATHLTALCEVVEAAATKRKEGIGTLLLSIEAEFERVREMLETYRQKIAK